MAKTDKISEIEPKGSFIKRNYPKKKILNLILNLQTVNLLIYRFQSILLIFFIKVVIDEHNNF